MVKICSEIFTFVKQLSEDSDQFHEKICIRYRRFALYASLASPFVGLMSKPNQKAKYTFVGRRLGQLITKLPRADVQVVGNQRDLLFCIKHHIPFVSNNSAWPIIAEGLPSLGEDIHSCDKLIRFVQQFAEKMSGLVIVSNDSLPVERLMISAARKKNLKSVCVQDGLFMDISESYAVHGHFADHMFVFNDQQRDLLARKGVGKDKTTVMGFHTDYPPMNYFPALKKGNERRICLLGQPMWYFYPELFDKYLALVKNIIFNLEAAGFSVCYKPHPGEKKAPYLHEFKKTFDASLLEAFGCFDVFLAINSTALLEATLCGRVAIQIQADAFKDNSFAEYGFAHCVHESRLKELPHLVSQLSVFDNPANEQMLLRNVAERFLSALQNVDNKL